MAEPTGQLRVSSVQSSTPSVTGRAMPVSIEAEKSVLAALLLNDDNLTLVADFLKPVDFSLKSHQLIYQAILDVAQQSQKVDIVVLNDYFERQQQVDDMGGVGYLLELQEDIPSVGLIQQHAKIVKDKAILRHLITAASDIIGTCYDNNIDEVDVVLDKAEQKIFQLASKIAPPSFVQLNVILKQAFHNLSQMKSTQQGVTGVSTGFVQFDEMTSGMQKSDLLILAGRPSMGKTALALNIALNSWRNGHAVGIFSLEMSSEQLVLRMLSSESCIPYQKIRNAQLSSEEFMEMTDTAARLAEAKIFIDDTPSLNIMELRAKARKLKSQVDLELIVIDYLQLLNSHQRHENRTQEISAISRSLKALAKELDIPVLALSQLSRSLETRMDKRPMLSDLRESGAIEQDGDVIFFVYRDVVYNPDTEYPDHAEIIIGKQRNGPVGSFHVGFHGEIARFADLQGG